MEKRETSLREKEIALSEREVTYKRQEAAIAQRERDIKDQMAALSHEAGEADKAERQRKARADAAAATAEAELDAAKAQLKAQEVSPASRSPLFNTICCLLDASCSLLAVEFHACNLTFR